MSNETELLDTDEIVRELYSISEQEKLTAERDDITAEERSLAITMSVSFQALAAVADLYSKMATTISAAENADLDLISMETRLATLERGQIDVAQVKKIQERRETLLACSAEMRGWVETIAKAGLLTGIWLGASGL